VQIVGDQALGQSFVISQSYDRIVADFANNPDYALRWPPEIFAQELRLLINQATSYGIDDSWFEDVELLLRQAFDSQVPGDDFERVRRLPPTPAYNYDEEPF